MTDHWILGISIEDQNDSVLPLIAVEIMPATDAMADPQRNAATFADNISSIARK
jgi:hypothetical protein